MNTLSLMRPNHFLDCKDKLKIVKNCLTFFPLFVMHSAMYYFCSSKNLCSEGFTIDEHYSIFNRDYYLTFLFSVQNRCMKLKIRKTRGRRLCLKTLPIRPYALLAKKLQLLFSSFTYTKLNSIRTHCSYVTSTYKFNAYKSML